MTDRYSRVLRAWNKSGELANKPQGKAPAHSWGHSRSYSKASIKFTAVIPWLLYISKLSLGGETGVLSLHITPFITLGLNWRIQK